MARVKRGITVKARHKKIIDMAAGYRGRSGNCYRSALQRVEKALQYAYRDRRNRKRDFRALWIQRINAAVSLEGLTYSRFVSGALRAGIEINRKVLADLAAQEPMAFKAIVSKAKEALAAF